MGIAFQDQVLKPANAAKRLGILLSAAPAEFQSHPLTRAELAELESNPPQWLVALRKDGPHPKSVVAGRLGVSISGLARNGVTDPLTTTDIDQLRANPPQWLIHERQVAREVAGESNDRGSLEP